MLFTDTTNCKSKEKSFCHAWYLPKRASFKCAEAVKAAAAAAAAFSVSKVSSFRSLLVREIDIKSKNNKKREAVLFISPALQNHFAAVSITIQRKTRVSPSPKSQVSKGVWVVVLKDKWRVLHILPTQYPKITLSSNVAPNHLSEENIQMETKKVIL